MNGLCRGITSKLQCDQASCKIAWKNSSIRSAGQWLLEKAGDCIVDGISYAGGRKGPISCDGLKNVGEGLRQGLTYVFIQKPSSADSQQYSSDFEAQNPFDNRRSSEKDFPPESFASNVKPDEKKPSPRGHSGSFNGDGRRYFHYDSTALPADQVKKASKGGKGGGSGRRLPSSRARQTLSERAQEHKVPASRTERLASFGGLAVGLGVGTIAEIARRSLGIKEGKAVVGEDSNPILSEANAERIVNTLCRVRGAALKLGQIISIQDNAYLNPQLQNIFERVRQSADFMPTWQIEKAFKQELGKDWKSKFASVEMKPFAAASIGQVHLGVLLDGREVAMKVQYPGVETSIDSDINNLMTVLRLWNVLPEGSYVDNAVAVARRELSWEVDYHREAESCKRMRILLKDDPVFYVPDIVDEFSTKRLLTQELIYGVPLDKAVNYDQETRNYICVNVLRLCLAELFEFQFMQTDPNWSNFFYNDETKKISLLDFGACREYDKSFVDTYIRVIKAAQDGSSADIEKWSKKLDFLTGYEPKVMLDAHVDAVMILGEAFASETPFDFSQQSVTERIKQIIPVMLKHRLTPPPEESYSLHRKMSGAFLLCTKLSAKIDCKSLFDHSWKNYKFSDAII